MEETVAPDAPERQAIRAALRATVMQWLRPAAIGLAALLALSALLDLHLLPAHAARPVAFADAAASLALNLLFLAIVLRWARPAAAHWWALAGALVVLADATLSLSLTQDPARSFGLPLLQLGAGLLFLSWPALLVVLAASNLAWLAVALPHGLSGPWGAQGLLLAASTALAAVAHAVRVRSLGRLELLRLRSQAIERDLRASLRAGHEATAQARASERRFRLVAEATSEGVCVHDGVRVQDANPAFAALLGLPLHALVGQPVLELVQASHQRTVAQLLRAPHASPLEAPLARADGAPVWVEMRAAVAKPDGTYVLAVRDLAPRRHAEQAARLASERLAEIEGLKEANDLRTRFISMASHEIRTPLTPIALQVSLLRQPGALDPRQQRALDIIHRNLERLNRLAADILDSCRIQADRLGVERSRTDLDALLRDAVDSMRDLALGKGVDLEARLQPGTWVLADRDRIHQVVMNLVGNAVKFTPAGGRIEVASWREGTQVTVEVRDTGLGVRPEDQPRLFQPFTQVHDPGAVPAQGSGLGLHICRGIVERHGGTVWCASEGLGRGARFCFTLPLDAADGTADAPQGGR